MLGGLGLGEPVDESSSDQFTAEIEAAGDEWYNIIQVSDLATAESESYPLAAQFISLWFPLGHVKSTKSADEHFINVFRESEKWLRFE